MVISFIRCLFLLLPTFLFSGEFIAHVSKNEMGIGESFTLTLTVKDASAKTSPSIDSLKKLFSIHSQQQSSNTIFNNGKLSSSYIWKFVLIPQHQGEHLIPSFNLETSEGLLSTKPIPIRVVKNSSSNSSQADESKIASYAELSNVNPYKNEPLFLTLKLISKQSLQNVQVQKFELEGAIIEPVGEPVIYDKIDNGIRVGVIEFNYLITPVQTGSLLVPSIVIQGEIHQKRRSESFFDEGFDPYSLFQGLVPLTPFVSSTEEKMLNVQPPIAEVNPWLPIHSLKMEEYLDSSQNFQEGEIFTRSIIIEAEGVHSSQLPNLEELQANRSELKVYADKPELKDEIKKGKLKSARKEQYTFIPQKSGEVTLPEITIAWWDVINHKKMVSTIPSRIINIIPQIRNNTEIQKLPNEPKEMNVKPFTTHIVDNLILYVLITGLSILLLGAIFWLILLQRKMTRLFEKGEKKKEEAILTPSQSTAKKTSTPKAIKRRDKLDDLNPT